MRDDDALDPHLLDAWEATSGTKVDRTGVTGPMAEIYPAAARRLWHLGVVRSVGELAARVPLQFGDATLASRFEASEHAFDARHRRRSFHVDILDFRMRVRRTEKVSARLAGAGNIVRILPLARDETEVFLAAHRRADTGRAHGVLPGQTFWCNYSVRNSFIASRARRRRWP